MRTLMRILPVVLIVVASAALLFAETDVEKTQKTPGTMPDPRPRIRTVWGRVEELSPDLTKLAVKVETEEGEGIQIFNLTEDTKVRKEEKVKTVKDLTRGIVVIVFYLPKNDDEKHDTAVLVRIREDVDWRPRPRPRPRPGPR